MKLAGRIADKNAHVADSAPVTIAFLGDSVTQGCFEIYREDNGIGCVCSVNDTYHHKLARRIEALFPNVSLTVINAGISGDNAPGGARRVGRDVIAYKPDLCVVCFGLNDANGGIERMDNYKTALESIFTQLNEAGIETLFMTPNMMGTRVLPEETDPFLREVLTSIVAHQNNGDMDAYMECARETAAKCNVPVCDCYKKWKIMHKYGCDITRLLANHVNHPTREMHGLFADSLFEKIFEE